MDFLKKLYNAVISKKNVRQKPELTPTNVEKVNDIEEIEDDNSSTVGGPFRVRTVTQPLDYFKDDLDSKNRVFSPSGRYILITVYRGCENSDGLFLMPKLEIVDFSNRKARLYGSSDSAVGSFSGKLCTSYWLSDSQIISVYVREEKKVTQSLYTLDHKKRTYKEEVFEYVELGVGIIKRSRSHPNPLYIDNKAYFTITAYNFFFLIPWIPSSEITQLTTIQLNKDDPVLDSEDYSLIVGQESIYQPSFHFISGSRAYFYIKKWSWIDDMESFNHPGIHALPTEVACIDFTECKELDVNEVYEFPFEIAHFNESNHSANGIVAEFIFEQWWYDSYLIDLYGEKEEPNPLSEKIYLCEQNVHFHKYPSPRLFFHGRYITHMSHVEDNFYKYDGGEIFDLQTMTWAKLPKKWIETTAWASEKDVAFHNNMMFQFDHMKSGFDFYFAEVRMEQPRWKSLADLCRQKLIYNEESIKVSPKLLNIIFPSP